MLSNYEKRFFENGESVWFCRYTGLKNLLHWHFETEIILIESGNATVVLDSRCYNGSEGDVFFCPGGCLHYISSEKDCRIRIIICDTSVCADALAERIAEADVVRDDGRYRAIIEEIGTILVEKPQLYRYPARNRAEALILDILGRIPASGDFAKGSQLTVYRELISKIHAGFRTITFSEAASEIGYSQAQFARIFRKISGMTFCDYLNRIRINNATTMLRNRQKKFSCTEVAAECGFGTVRNFNRVFLKYTGYSPRQLPADYTLSGSIVAPSRDDFIPTAFFDSE